MTNPLVLVADADPKNLQILKENLEASGFVVITVSSGNKAWEEIQQAPPQLVLTEVNLPGLTGYQLLERLQADPNTKAIPLIFLTNQREIQQRVRAFEIGAKDYLVKPLHVKEVIAHLRMVMRRLERRKTEQLETYMKFSGRLDQLNLADLIESLGVERKTGVLTLSNGRRTGQVYFRDGVIVNASLGDLRQEAAIYQMIPWHQGYFNMIFKEIDIPDEIAVSNLGLLLHGIKRMEIRDKLMGQLSSPETAFTITPTFKMLIAKKKIASDVSNFVNLLDGKRTVEQIIDESGLDDLVTLKRILRLYQQGFIKPTIPPAKKPVLPVKIEGDEEQIKYLSQPQPPGEELFPAEPIGKPLPEKDIFDHRPKEKRTELEKEIKPIVERIEQERKKILVPEAPEKRDEPMVVPQKDEQELPEEILAASADLTSSIDLEQQEFIPVSEETYIDEELIRQPMDTDYHRSITSLIGETEESLTLPEEEISEPTAVEPELHQYELEEKKPDLSPPTPPLPEIDAPSQPEKKRVGLAETTPIKNNFLIISVDDDCKDELMDILTNDNFVSKKIEELNDLQIDFGKIKVDGFSQFNIISIAVDKPFNAFVESIKQKVMGLIIAVDCTRHDTWEYTTYLIHSIGHKFQLPFVVVVMNFHDQNSVTMDIIRYQLKLDESIPLIAWDAVDKSSIRKLLTLITNSHSSQMSRKPAELLDSLVEKMMF